MAERTQRIVAGKKSSSGVSVSRRDGKRARSPSQQIGIAEDGGSDEHEENLPKRRKVAKAGARLDEEEEEEEAYVVRISKTDSQADLFNSIVDSSTKPTKRKKSAEPAAARQVSQHVRHCLCKAMADNAFLVQCWQCGEWYHSGCVNNSEYSPRTYRGRTKWAQKKDFEYWEDEIFKCAQC